MQIDRRVTNGLAWAGVLLVVGIPAADLVSAQFMGDRTAAAPAQIAVVEPIAPIPAPLSQRPVEEVPEVEVAVAAPAPALVKPVAPAVVAHATPTAAQTASVVDSYLQSGKGLPSYITGAPSAAPAPTQVATTPPARTPIITQTETSAPTDPIQVASIPDKVAPMPMPLSMRPVATPVAVMQPSETLIIPPSANGPRPPANVTAEDLEDWETGPLSDFLARRQQQAEARSGDEGQGFFLDEAPPRTRQPDRVIGPANDFFFPFSN